MSKVAAILGFCLVTLWILVEEWRLDLARNHRIGADQFIVLFSTAGEFEGPNLSLWIVPEGVALPDPNEEEDPGNSDEDPSVKP